jgi:ABC-type multidrug transport system ATPase subunit
MRDSASTAGAETCTNPITMVRFGVQVAKMIQLHACRQQRMGVILMGTSGSGKSTVWKTLAAAYKILGQAPTLFTLNPKSMPRKQLLGSMDSETRCSNDLQTESQLQLVPVMHHGC